jgi:hypothetical protein
MEDGGAQGLKKMGAHACAVSPQPARPRPTPHSPRHASAHARAPLATSAGALAHQMGLMACWLARRADELFAGVDNAAEEQFKRSTVGLVSAEDFKKKRAESALLKEKLERQRCAALLAGAACSRGGGAEAVRVQASRARRAAPQKGG